LTVKNHMEKMAHVLYKFHFVILWMAYIDNWHCNFSQLTYFAAEVITVATDGIATTTRYLY